VNIFNAFRIFEKDGQIQGKLVRLTLDELSPGNVVIKTTHSSVNYKDALAATGAGKILQRFPLIGGIDVSGTVVSSTDERYLEGDEVLVTGHGLGVSADGGYSEYARVPADWVVPLPKGLTTFDAMAIGTAGFTAALSVVQMERNGLTPGDGPVIVTGATGGVGSLAVDILATLGYDVTAMTGKDSEHDYLRTLGARNIISRSECQIGIRPLEKTRWAGAVDPVGGEILAWLTRTMNTGGSIASSGLTAGIELRTTVLPFILRGVNILGIDSVTCANNLRRNVWHRLATDMRPTHLKKIAQTVPLSGLPKTFLTLLNGEMRGRFVVTVAQPDH
jgi:NADPH2:quinone reductase